MLSQIAGNLSSYVSDSIWPQKPILTSSTVKKIALLALTLGVFYVGFQLSGMFQGFSPTNMCNDSTLGGDFCSGNLGIPRSGMPQLEGHVKRDFLEKYSATCSNFDPISLRSTQSEINFEKVTGIVQSALDGVFNPCTDGIITALGGNNTVRVVDGHHRAAACYRLAQSSVSFAFQIFTHHIPESIETVIGNANSFDGVEQYDLNYFEK